MEKGPINTRNRTPRTLFGEIAITRGFITKRLLNKALSEQMGHKSCERSRPPMKLGEILQKNGWISNDQIRTVLSEQATAEMGPAAETEDGSMECIVSAGMTKQEVQKTYSNLQPRVWYTLDEQEVWFYKNPEKKNIYFREDRVERVKYVL